MSGIVGIPSRPGAVQANRFCMDEKKRHTAWGSTRLVQAVQAHPDLSRTRDMRGHIRIRVGSQSAWTAWTGFEKGRAVMRFFSSMQNQSAWTCLDVSRKREKKRKDEKRDHRTDGGRYWRTSTIQRFPCRSSFMTRPSRWSELRTSWVSSGARPCSFSAKPDSSASGSSPSLS